MLITYVAGVMMTVVAIVACYVVRSTYIEDLEEVSENVVVVVKSELSGMFAFIVIFLIIILCWFPYQFRIRKRAEEEFESVYEHIHKPEFSMAEFLNKHNSLLDKMPFTAKEVAVLREHHGKKQVDIQSQTNRPLGNCLICRQEFKGGDFLIQHPWCYHLYHSACLEHWLCKENIEQVYCPSCKTCTRRAMLGSLPVKHASLDHVPLVAPHSAN